jgi:hypothetical protein
MRKRGGGEEGERVKDEGRKRGQRKGRKRDSREGPKRGSRVITGCFNFIYTMQKIKKRITLKSLYKIKVAGTVGRRYIHQKRNQSTEFFHYAKNIGRNYHLERCCASVTFWYGYGSAHLTKRSGSCYFRQ